MKSKRIYSIILAFVSLGLIIAFGYYLYINKDKYLNLLQVSPLPVISILLLSIIPIVINGVINKFLFQSLGVEISHRDSFFLSSASSLANQLPLSGGLISKGVYLKQKYGLSYTKFLSANVALFLCFIASNGVVGLIVLLFRYLSENLIVSPLLILGFLSMASCILIFALPVDRLKIPDRIRKIVHQALDGWSIIRKQPILIVKLIGLQTALVTLLAIRYWLAFQMVSQNIMLGDAMLFSSATILTQLVSVAPGGLGVREAIVGIIATTLGFETTVSVLAVGIDRLLSTIPILVFGGISAIILGRQMTELKEKMHNQNIVN